jgi:hypothetical protein
LEPDTVEVAARVEAGPQRNRVVQRQLDAAFKLADPFHPGCFEIGLGMI